MPFDSFTPRSFTAASVRANAPAAPGIYGVSNSQEWIYIGEADDVQASLLGDLLHGGSELMALRPTGFVFELCYPEARGARLDRLVHEYNPVCNRRIQSATGGTI